MNILLVDDHEPTRQEMLRLLGLESDLRVVGMVDTGEQAVQEAKRLQPAVVIMDLMLRGINGIEATKQIVSALPGTKVMALSNHSGRILVECMLTAGALGYVRKDRAYEELIPAIRSICAGQRFLGKGLDP